MRSRASHAPKTPANDENSGYSPDRNGGAGAPSSAAADGLQVTGEPVEDARQLANTAQEPLVPVENDKPTVLALREIAEGHVNAKNVDFTEEEQQV